jgi:hypothetical protein
LITCGILAALGACSSERGAPAAERGAAAAGRGSGAEQARGPAPRRAFYYWRTTLSIGEAEQKALTELSIDRVYVRMFDVVWQDGAARLVGKLERAAGSAGELRLAWVPVVFVREEVLRQLSEEQRAQLAAELWREVAAIASGFPRAPEELQLDCDWTDRSQQAFFALAREVKRQSGLRLSATIRLHQVKYRERTGVPPVERGMLMFYNMGEISAAAGARSIYDAATAERYLARLAEYPLPLDVALPIWSWTLHARDGRVIDVLQSTDPEELEGQAFLERRASGGQAGGGQPSDGGASGGVSSEEASGGVSGGTSGGASGGAKVSEATTAGEELRYVAKETAFFRGVLLRPGDELVGEVVGPGEALAAARQVGPRLAPVAASGAGSTGSASSASSATSNSGGKGGAARTVALFDLSERNLARHDAASLERLFQSIR